MVAEPIEQDRARTACLVAIRDWMQRSYSTWDARKGVEGQVAEIAAIHKAETKDPAVRSRYKVPCKKKDE